MIQATRSTKRKAELLLALRETRADIAAGRFQICTATEHFAEIERMLNDDADMALAGNYSTTERAKLDTSFAQ